jgi:type IV secretion system protein VirB6
MPGGCPTFAPNGDFLSQVLIVVDCHAQSIGEGGYQALTSPGSSGGTILTALLTIFVALFGYRMLFGHMPDLREGVLAVVKVGLAVTLATSWPVFRTLAYDVAFQGPAQVASQIGQQSGVPGSEGGMIARLQGVDNLLAELMVLGTGKPPDTEQAFVNNEGLTPQEQAQAQQHLQALQQRPPWNPAVPAKMVAQARTLYLTGAIGAFASVRLLAGILLALGPLFALLLLFDTTRGLFEGWVRVLAGAALGALSTSLLLGVELALMEPWMANVITQRRYDVPTPNVPVELLVMSLVFLLALIGALIATARVARGFRIPQAVRVVAQRWMQTLDSRPAAAGAVSSSTSETRHEPADQRSRAFAVADAVAATQRREAIAGIPAPAHLASVAGGETVRRDAAAAGALPPVPLGQSYRRRTKTRVSAGARRRDRMA